MRPNTKADIYKRIDMRGRNECWPWTGYVNPYGYAVARMSGKHCQVHRLVYAWEYGAIPEGWDWTIDHICFNRSCLNPRHLRLMPRSQNAARKQIHEMHICKRGHDLTVTGKDIGNGRRQCVECLKITSAAHYKKLKRGEYTPTKPTDCKRGHGADSFKQHPDGRWYCAECKRIINKKPAKPKSDTCKHGHYYATHGKVEANGNRRCITCHNARRRERAAERRS